MSSSLFVFFRNVFSAAIVGNKSPVLVWLVVNESQVTTVAILWLFVVGADEPHFSSWRATIHIIQMAVAVGIT